jgi:hypothetical protein
LEHNTDRSKTFTEPSGQKFDYLVEAIDKVDRTSLSLLVFPLVRECLSTLAAIVQNTEINGKRNDPEWHLA